MTYIEIVCTGGEALHIGGVGGVEGHRVALTPDLIHEIPRHNGGVILVQNTSVCVLQRSTVL